MLVELDRIIIDTEYIKSPIPNPLSLHGEDFSGWEMKLKGDFEGISIYISRKGYENLKQAIQKG